jgi:putative ABC transport system permease protein
MPPAVVTATSGPAVLAGGICAALLAPALLRAGLSVCRPLGQVVFGPATELIHASARARSGQLATVTACVALVVGIGVGNLGTGAVAGGASQGANVQGLVNALLAAVAVAYAAIAVANTLAVSIVSRRRELALLRLVGATTPQVRLALAVEVTLAALAGAGAGLVIAAAAVIPTAVTVGRSPATLPVAAILIAALAVVAALVFPVTRYASTRSLSRPPGDVLASEVA